MIEIWQADPQGNYNTDQESDFLGFGRMGTGGEDFIGFNFPCNICSMDSATFLFISKP